MGWILFKLAVGNRYYSLTLNWKMIKDFTWYFVYRAVTCFGRSPIFAYNIEMPLTSFSLARLHSWPIPGLKKSTRSFFIMLVQPGKWYFQSQYWTKVCHRNLQTLAFQFHTICVDKGDTHSLIWTWFYIQAYQQSNNKQSLHSQVVSVSVSNLWLPCCA